MPRILAFAGSTRKDSFNGKLVRIAANAARNAGGEVTLVDLAEYDMPLFNQDLEAEHGLPENARKLKKLFLEHDGLLIAAPEYNSSITPLMKNTLDWVSRKESGGEAPGAAYKDKVAALLSASPGALGGLRGLVVMRMLLTTLGVHILPDQQAVGGAATAFTADGALADPAMQANVERIAAKLVTTTAKLKP